MKKLNFTAGACAAVVVAMTACTAEHPCAPGMGFVALQLTCDPAVTVASRAAAPVASLGDISVNDLTLTLTSADGTVSETIAYADFGAERELNIGSYTLTAAYGDADAEGFDCPALSGSAQFDIAEDQLTAVDLTATPPKAMVTVKYDKTLTDYMTSCSARLHTPGGEYIDYPADETRPVYLRAGKVNLQATFVKPNGKGATLDVADFDAEPRTHYVVTLTLGGDGAGEVSSLVVKYDDLLQRKDVNIDISDYTLDSPAPVVTAVNFTDGETLSIIDGWSIDPRPSFNIDARGGIAKAVLTTRGTLVEQGWPAEVDLVAADETMRQTLANFGYKDMGLFHNPAKMAAVGVGYVAPNINPTGDSPVEFILTVTDRMGKVSEPLGFKVAVTPLTLHMSTSNYYGGTPTQDISLTYNGAQSVADGVKFSVLTDKNAYQEVKPVKVTDVRRNVFTVTLPVPATAKTPLTYRAESRGVTSDLVVSSTPTKLTLSVKPEDVFAEKAFVTLSPANFELTGKEVKVYNAAGRELKSTLSGHELTVSGLTAGTTNEIYATVGNLRTPAITMSTEKMLTVRNGNLDNGWEVEERKALAANGRFHFAPEPWNTVNEVSFSHMYAGTSYSMLSCTEPTDDARSGTAALIRTVGYGQATLFNTPAYWVAGELYLGTYDGGPVRGISFASRPSAVTFWYKYEPFNSSRGVAEAKVYDAAGNVIASGRLLLDAAWAYTRGKIDLTYARGAAKAAKLEINFKSMDGTADSSCTENNSSAYSYGAALYIDDVSTSY